jgi:putative ATP-dependent endonuclease of the OLD family
VRFNLHQISEIKIENYKSIIEFSFSLSAYTPMVGYNNAGKTNILRALSWIVKKASLPAGDFYDPEKPVVVTATISGINEEVLEAIGERHRPRLEAFVAEEKLSIRRTQFEPEAKVADIRLEVRDPNQEEGDGWEQNPAGIDAAISHIFPEAIFIGAMENAAEDVAKYAAGTTIGKLIKEIIGPITVAHAGPVSEALSEIGKKLSADGEEKDDTLVNLDNQIEVELAKFFPGVSAKTHIPTPEFSDFLKGATIKLVDQSANAQARDASSFGHGAQRAVQIALIKCLAELKRGAVDKGRTTLLLIDEPEIYLHPQAIEVVRASLCRLSEEGYQVVFSTHSPNMISRHDAGNSLLVRRTNELGTFAFPKIASAVSSAIAEAAHQAETLFTLTNSSKVLFCEQVVLVEGKTERVLLPDAFSFELGLSLDEAKIGMVELGSVDSVPNAMLVLDAMGIPTKAVVDLDFAFRGAVQKGLLPRAHLGLAECRQILARLAAAGRLAIGPDGLPTSSNGVSASAAFEIMATDPAADVHIQNIHDDLLQKGIWCWKKGSIESHLGLAAKSPAAHMNFLNKMPDAVYRAGLPDFVSFQAMMIWLRT